MTLQDAIDNAPSWARWLGVDDDCNGFYYNYEPVFIDCAYTPVGPYEYLVKHAGRIQGATGPQLIEVNK